jgi:hypothetical protein
MVAIQRSLPSLNLLRNIENDQMREDFYHVTPGKLTK